MPFIFIKKHKCAMSKIAIKGKCLTQEPRSTRTPSATAMYTFYYPALLQFALRYSADAIRPEIRVPRLDATQATQILIADLLPFGYQILVRDILV